MESKSELLERILQYNNFKIERKMKETAIREMVDFVKVFVEYADKEDPEFWEKCLDKPKDLYSPEGIAAIINIIPSWSYDEPLIMTNYEYINRLLDCIIALESQYADPERKGVWFDDEQVEEGMIELLRYGRYDEEGYTTDELTEKIHELAISIMSISTGIDILKIGKVSVETDRSRILIPAIISGPKGQEKVKVLFDTGAEETLVQRETAEKLGLKKTGKVRHIRGISGIVQKCEEATMCIKILQGEKETSGCWRVSIFDNVREITGGSPVLLGMDYATERGKKIGVHIE